MNYLKTYKLFESENALNNLIKNARKWQESDFIEEYIDLLNISTAKIIDNVYKGDKIQITKDKKPYKEVISDKDYGYNVWQFIVDSVPELQEEAKKAYNVNKNNSKPKFDSNADIITAYHASPNKFNMFKYQDKSTSGQLGANTGFFFFLDEKYADYYATVLKDNHGEAYLYTVNINIKNQLELNGVDIGTNWNRIAELENAEGEGYDTVIIKDADTGYGITDELVVFDDDNIKIKDVKKY